MSDKKADKLASLHEILKDPLRQKILLKLGEHDSIGFDELMKELKIDDEEEVYDQLKILGDLVTKKEEEYLFNKQGVSKKLGGQYALTGKGHDAVDEMIEFPEIEAENYKDKLFGKDALTRHKIAYIIGGAWAGFFISLFVSILCLNSLLSIWLKEPWPDQPNSSGSISVYTSTDWIFFIMIIFVAPMVGALAGYLIGKRNRFEQPEPEWNQ